MCDAGEKHPGRVTTLGGGIFLGICLHICPRPGPNFLYIRGARVSIDRVFLGHRVLVNVLEVNCG